MTCDYFRIERPEDPNFHEQWAMQLGDRAQQALLVAAIFAVLAPLVSMGLSDSSFDAQVISGALLGTASLVALIFAGYFQRKGAKLSLEQSIVRYQENQKAAKWESQVFQSIRTNRSEKTLKGCLPADLTAFLEAANQNLRQYEWDDDGKARLYRLIQTNTNWKQCLESAMTFQNGPAALLQIEIERVVSADGIMEEAEYENISTQVATVIKEISRQ